MITKKQLEKMLRRVEKKYKSRVKLMKTSVSGNIAYGSFKELSEAYAPYVETQLLKKLLRTYSK